MNKEIYLLTGAAGLLGNNIALSLIEQGKSVRALVLEGDPAAKNMTKGIELCIGDVTDTASLQRFFDVLDDKEIIVIHCASIVSLFPLPNPKVFDVNVTGTQNIIRACIENNVKKLVYISSTGAISELPNHEVIREPDFFEPDNVVGYYSKTKALATELVFKAVTEQKLNASVIYPSGICGPNDYAFGPVTKVITDYCDGKMPVGFEGYFNSVDVRDLANGVIKCAQKGGMGEGYIMSNEMVSIKRLFKLISQTSGAPLVETILPVNVMLENAAQSIADNPQKEEKLKTLEFRLYNMTRNNNFSSEKAMHELGYKTRPFSDTIIDEVNWLIDIGKIQKQNRSYSTMHRQMHV